MIKKLFSGLLALFMTVSALPAFAATNGVPDLIITDIRISNPNYKVGDIVSFDFDVKNIGTAAMKLGWIAIQSGQTSGVTPLVNAGRWTRPWIFPGQTITTTLDNFRVDNDNITIKGLCNSSAFVAGATTPEGNKANNSLSVSFSPNAVGRNLVIEDLRLTETNIKDGNVASFEIDYANTGISDIPQSEIEIKLTIGRQTYTVRENTSVLAGERRTVKSDPLYLKGNTATVYSHINPGNKAPEDQTDDNETAYQFSALVAKKQDYTWQPVRIGGGGWPRIGYVSEHTKDQVFQLTDVNGLYKYDEYTKTHINLTDNLQFGTAETIGAGYKLAIGVEQDPQNPDIIYYACGSSASGEGRKNTCYVLRSSDGGKTWESMNIPFVFGEDLSFCNSVIDLDPKNSDVLYVSTGTGLWRTKNAKSKSPEWEKLTVPGIEMPIGKSGDTTNTIYPTPVVGVVVDKTSTLSGGVSQVVYTAVRNVGVLKSTDGGNTFALMDGCPTGELYNINIDSNGGLVVSGAQCVWSYSKDTDEWTDITPVKGGSMETYNIPLHSTVHPNNPNLIAATTRSVYVRQVFVSNDRGKTWREILMNRAPIISPTYGRDFTDTVKNKIPWMSWTAIDSSPSWVAFDPFNDGRLFINAWYGTYQTLDYTASTVQWEETTWGIEEGFVRSLVALPEGANYELLLGTNDFCGMAFDNIFEFTGKAFEPWTQETTGLAYMESNPNFVVRNGGTARGAGEGNGFYSTDGGGTWTEFPTYPMKDSVAERQQAGKIVVASDVNSNGNPAIMIVTLGTNGTLPEGSTHGRIWRTDDLGQTWTWIDSLPVNAIERFMDTCEPLVADKLNKNKFYFYDFRTGDVYRSTDNGKTFSVVGSLPIGDTESSMVAVPGKEGELFVNLSYSGLWHSTDGGENWTQITTVERARFFDVGKEASCSPDNPTLYVLGEVKKTYGIFRSTDMGASWVRIDDPDQESLWNTISLLRADKREFGKVYVGTEGSGIIVGYLGEDKMQPRTAIYDFIDGKTVTSKILSVRGGTTKPGTVYISVNGGAAITPTLDEDNRFTADLTLSKGSNTITIYSQDVNGYKSEETTYTVNYN